MFNKIEINLNENINNFIVNDKPTEIFGCIADIQYSNIENSTDPKTSITRYYRNSLNQIDDTIRKWQLYENDHEIDMKFILQLGDLIDGKSKTAEDGSLISMNTVLKHLSTSNTDILHIFGNHEFYNFQRSQLINLPLNTAKILNQNLNANYYTYEISYNLKLICLDFYEYSVLGYDHENDKNNELFIKAKEYVNSFKTHFTAFNGGLSDVQFNWLALQLEECRKNKSKVILAGHIPINNKAANNKYCAWNSKEILELLWKFNDVVCVYLAGHDHKGGYIQENNIHFITLPGIVELKPGSSSFLTFLVYKNKLIIDFTK